MKNRLPETERRLTSAIASPICTNFSRNPMTVVKLSDDVVAETMLIAVPAAPMPDGVDMFEDPPHYARKVQAGPGPAQA
jgi:hypothetical protein